MRKIMVKIHHSLKDYEIDELGNIYIKGIKQLFSENFSYAGKIHNIENIICRVFLENPHNFRIVVFKDGNSKNYNLNNLEFSSINQEEYNYLHSNDFKNPYKCCIKCKEFKRWEDFDSSKKVLGRKTNTCKECLYKTRSLKKEEYNTKRNSRRKITNQEKVYNRRKYDKLKEDPLKYNEFLEKNRTYSKNNWKVTVLSRLKCRALKEGLEFNLNKEDLILEEFCPILGIPITIGNKDKMSCVSWDKIIPENGYVKGNVRCISLKANVMKNNATIEELEIFVKNIMNYVNKLDSNVN